MYAGKRTFCTEVQGVQDNDKIVHLFPFFVLRICSSFEKMNLIFSLKPPYVTTCTASWISDLLLGLISFQLFIGFLLFCGLWKFTIFPSYMLSWAIWIQSTKHTLFP